MTDLEYLIEQIDAKVEELTETINDLPGLSPRRIYNQGKKDAYSAILIVLQEGEDIWAARQ